MPEYDRLRTASWLPKEGVEPFSAQHHTFTMPPRWLDEIRAVTAAARGKSPEHVTLPIRSLNGVLAATVPDLVTITDDYKRFDQPWLCTDEPVPPHAMTRLLKAWLGDIAEGSDLGRRELREALQRIDVHDGYEDAWKLESVNLWESGEPGPGGTARPRDWLFRLLPDVIAQRIAALEPYEHQGTQVQFKQVACDQGAELMAFPPLTAEQGKRTYYFSPFIHVSLHTVPFSPLPRVHLHAGIRRWVRRVPKNAEDTGRLFLPNGQGASVYLRLHRPWADFSPPRRLAKAAIAYDKGSMAWRTGGSGSMLEALDRTGEFPDIGTILNATHHYIDNREDGIWAAITYRTMYGGHPVDLGYSPTERMRLLEWAGTALESHYRPAPALDRVVRRHKPAPAFTSKPTEPTRAAAWRALLERSLNGEPLRVDMLYQQSDPEIRERLAETIRTQLLTEEAPPVLDRSTGRYEYRFDAGPVSVVLTAHPIADLGEPLAIDGHAPRPGPEYEAAEQERAEALKSYIGELGLQGEALLIELPGAADYEERRRLPDPKWALRKGAAMAGRVTQFLTPRRSTGPKIEKDDSMQARAKAAWEDCLRSIGIRFTPPVPTGSSLPEELNLLAVWVVQSNRTEDSKHHLFEPVAVLSSPDEPRVLARTSRTSGWARYPEVLCDMVLTAADRKEDRNRDAKHARFARFLRTTLMSPTVRRHPTLLLAAANNSRSADRWDWLQDAKLQPDAIQIGGLPVQRLGVYGPGLRIVRARKKGGNRETPPWWVAKHDPDLDEPIAGEAVGFWRMSEDHERVFYSLCERNSNLGKPNTRLAKLTPWRKARVKGDPSTIETRAAAPDTSLMVPDLMELTVAGLQPGDQAADWALYAHQLRIVPEFQLGLAWPLPLKLAEDIGEYAHPAAPEGAAVDERQRQPEEEEAEQ